MRLEDITPADVVYISGPMTGQPDCNRPLFNAVAERLQVKARCRVLNPARHPDGLGEWADYMRLALADLARATKVVVLPGWDKSRGARLENDIARRLGIRRVFIKITKMEAGQ
jgi:hypothetical protein